MIPLPIIKKPIKINNNKRKSSLIFSGPLGRNQIHLKKLDQKGIWYMSFLDRTLFLSKQAAPIKNLIKSQIYGITRGFLIFLQMYGVGYRFLFNDKNQTLRMKLGFSHLVKIQIPISFRLFLVKPTLLCLFGIDKNQIIQTATKIQSIRPPSVYKGKGIRFLNQKVIVKQFKEKLS